MIKSFLRKLIPPPLYHYGFQIIREGKNCYKLFSLARRLGVPEILIYFGVAPGDDLLCTVVLHELQKRGHAPLWIMSNNSELFLGNIDVQQIVPIDDYYREFVIRWRKKYQYLKYAESDSDFTTSIPPTKHIIAELCSCAGITGKIDIRPYFHLNSEEKKSAIWATDKIAIQSSGLATKWPMFNKQWYPERFQDVVNQLKDTYQFIQLGSASDPPLSGVIDLRGKTTIRESAAVLANSRLYVGNVGFLMHLARANECPSVIIYGGREAPWQSGYTCNINLYSPVSCAPCWLWNHCDYGKICMQNISATEVVNSIVDLLNRPRVQLRVDSVTI